MGVNVSLVAKHQVACDSKEDTIALVEKHRRERRPKIAQHPRLESALP